MKLRSQDIRHPRAGLNKGFVHDLALAGGGKCRDAQGKLLPGVTNCSVTHPNGTVVFHPPPIWRSRWTPGPFTSTTCGCTPRRVEHGGRRTSTWRWSGHMFQRPRNGDRRVLPLLEHGHGATRRRAYSVLMYHSAIVQAEYTPAGPRRSCRPDVARRPPSKITVMIMPPITFCPYQRRPAWKASS